MLSRLSERREGRLALAWEPPAVDLCSASRHNVGRKMEDGQVVTAFEEVMAVREAFAGLKPPPPGAVSIEGVDPVFPTRFTIGEACAAVLGGGGVAGCD